MPRVTFVKNARKDNKVCLKGESYYWWKFRFGGKHYSLTRPKPSQLTQSNYLGTLYSICESVEEYGIEPGEEGAIENLRDEVVGQLEELRDECEESRSNMPEALQDSPTGELLQERYDAIDGALGDIENVEEPDQWQEARDSEEAYNEWLESEPDESDFDLTTEDGKQELADAREAFTDNQPEEVVEPEDFDRDEITGPIQDCFV
jgi:hypothetical protein